MIWRCSSPPGFYPLEINLCFSWILNIEDLIEQEEVVVKPCQRWSLLLSIKNSMIKMSLNVAGPVVNQPLRWKMKDFIEKAVSCQ